ncbi:DUF6502 family protein [Marinicella sp. S1101]|uniref:DUF6502 family protein n=1 Tax=Marinicella marina TaxID=2996016 RepID=UPI002260E186|nr:DUF6502 family protein [Marinicella marina]MCX7553820.1 DUF6502 family protein [Marinicella marina]MDJ1140896.1 DUF6502 family protein [Marinicella marina]
MSQKLVEVVRQMLIQIFRPLVRVLLRFNVPFHEVSEILKWTYVDVSSKYFGLNGKPPTKSRIAVITGLSRAQVDAQLKVDLFNADQSHRKWHRAGRVLTGWVEDEAYRNHRGQQIKIIPLESSDEPDFKYLVEKYSGGATIRSILDELLRSESVSFDPEGFVELIKPYYLTENDPDDIQNIDFLGLSTQYLLETIDHNIDPERKGPRFQRIILHDKLPKSLANIAESYARKKSQELANDVDEYIEHLIQHSDLEEEQDLLPYIGVGIYFYKADENHNEIHE